MKWLLTAHSVALAGLLVAGGRAHALEASVYARDLEILGAARTRHEVVRELLPRQPPAHFSSAELRETERLLSNLEIFDRVTVAMRGETLVVDVREKWTLIPAFDVASGTTLADTYLALGVTEHNLLGTAGRLSIAVEHNQRGFGFYLAFQEHEFRLRRWAFGAAASLGTSEAVFQSTGHDTSWATTKTEASTWLASPPFAQGALRYQVGVGYSFESNKPIDGEYEPPDGSALTLFSQLSWDRYRFHDLVPTGFRWQLSLGPGAFVPASQARHFAQSTLLTARRLGKQTVVMARVRAAANSRGNANYSYVVGSLEGVRGLADSVHRAWVESFVNLELRSALNLFERLALQGVIFADAAAYEEVTVHGQRGRTKTAASTGVGARLIPTFLAQLLLRCDIAYLWHPNRLWYYQLAVSQYF